MREYSPERSNFGPVSGAGELPARMDAIARRSRGLWHGGRIDPADPLPGDAVHVTVTVGTDVSARGMVVRYTTDGSIPDGASPAQPMQPKSPRWDAVARGYVEDWIAEIPAQAEGTLVRYRIQAQAHDGSVFWADPDPGTGEPGIFAFGIDRDEIPSWLRQAVIYHVDIDRFAPDPGGRFLKPEIPGGSRGGTIRGVTSRLDHIANLAANTIWLSGVVSFSSRDNGIDASPVGVRSGTEEHLRELIDAAHEKGIRVLLELDGADPTPPLERLIEAATYWLDMGVDGVSPGWGSWISQADLATLRRRLKQVKPDAAVVGGIDVGADVLATYEGRLDGALDFLLLERMRAFFAFDQIPAAEFWRFLERHLAWMPEHLSLPALLDIPDMHRFLWVANGDVRRLKIAALVQCALPHPPVISYGTEVGLNQRAGLVVSDGASQVDESHPPMLWGAEQDADLRSFFRSLVFWRVRQGVAGGMPMHVYAGAGGLLCFRTGQWFIVVNRDAEDAAIDFREHGEVWLVLGTEFDVQLHGSALQLPPMSGAVLRA